MKKLAIVTTHPIQYYAPVFKLLAQRGYINVKVFYTWGKGANNKYDPGFGKTVNWDVPLLDGYAYEWAENLSKQPGSHHFQGIVTPKLVGQINEYKPDALLVIGWAYQGHLAVLRYFKGKIPVYFRGDSTLLNQMPGVKDFVKTIFLKWIYHHVDHAFYVGTANKKYFLKYGLKESQLTFAPHAVDNDRFEKHPGSNLRETLGISSDATVILFAGKLEPVKNVDLLLKAVLNTNDPNAHLVIVGNGSKEGALKAIAENHTLSANIHWVNFQNQSQMPSVYNAASIFCLPSKSETWGLAVNEAMACGKAILVSNKVGCAPDLVKPGYNGDIFASENLDDLTAKLRKLLSPATNLQACGLRSADIIKDWNFTRIAEAIENRLNAPG